MQKKELIQSIKIIVLGLVLSLGVGFVSAQYTGPTGAPGNTTNTATPIYVSSAAQTKTGSLIAPFNTSTSSGNVFSSSGVATDSLFTQGGVQVGNLSGSGERFVCSDESGVLKAC